MLRSVPLMILITRCFDWYIASSDQLGCTLLLHCRCKRASNMDFAVVVIAADHPLFDTSAESCVAIYPRAWPFAPLEIGVTTARMAGALSFLDKLPLRLAARLLGIVSVSANAGFVADRE